MRPSVSRPQRAFTLIELLFVLLVATVLLTGLLVPVAAQVQMRRHEETRRLLEEAREAILGFAAANARLPCPAAPGSRGEESFAPGGDAANGRCARFYDGHLPAAALGLAPLDADGFLRDAWGAGANRLRYAVYGGAAVGGVDNPLTRANGMQAASLAALGSAPGFLHICARGRGANASGCGAAANQLTRRAAFVILSPGPNAHASPRPDSDETRNLDGDPVFVSREPSDVPEDPFDDILTWGPIPLVIARLLAAGRLP